MPLKKVSVSITVAKLPEDQEDSLFNPVCCHHTKDVQGELNGDELTTRCVTGSLGGPDRCDCVQDTCANTVQSTGAEHPVGILSRAL